jgi:cell division protease FtsH
MEMLTRPEVIASAIAIVGVTVLSLLLTRPGGRFADRRRPPQPVHRAAERERTGPDVTFHVVNSEGHGGAVAAKREPGRPSPAVAFSDVTSGHPKVTFADVAGLDDAIAELAEVREYLADPERFRALGAELPRGIVLHGLPGCGKTLLARALAGETGVPFYFVSAASFVEKFVGTGAARVRELFDQALKTSPSIVFIDELDAIGRRRNGESPGEREFDNTLNQLLVELDGFRGSSGVLVLGATNRLELIDPALLRPGRFDRRIQVDRPDRAGREKILRLHASRRPISPGVDWAEVAEATAGLSAAELANIVNEACLLAARRHRSEVTPADVEDANARVLSGTRSARLMGEEEKRVAAVHEAGHAILSLLVRGMKPPARISLMAPPDSVSKSAWSSGDDREILTKRDLIARLIVLLGGRAAEMNVFGEPSNRAEDDLAHAAELARRMVERWAMTGRFELAGGRGETVRHHFEGSAGGAEVRELLARSEQAARSILRDNNGDLQVVTAALAQRETLTAAQLSELTGRAGWNDGATGPVRHLRAI